MRPAPVATERLILVPAGASLARAAADDRGRLARLLRAEIPDAWPPELLADTLEFTAHTLEDDPDTAGWWIWYWLEADGRSARRLIGNGGFKGPPDPEGVVEVGYAVIDPAQRMGYATEAVRALVDWAFADPRVRAVGAETFPDSRPSLAIMERCGMQHVGPGTNDGVVRHAVSRERHALRSGASADPFDALQGFGARLRAAVAGLTNEQLHTPEGPDRWSVADVVQHLADIELIYGYRVRKVVAEPGASLDGCDQDAWARQFRPGADLDLEALLTDIERLRARTTAWLRKLDVQALSRTGMHSERGPECVAWTVRLLVEHDAQHLAQIARVREAMGA